MTDIQVPKEIELKQDMSEVPDYTRRGLLKGARFKLVSVKHGPYKNNTWIFFDLLGCKTEISEKYIRIIY